VILLALLQVSEAASNNIYMWGVGPQVSTVIYPTRFPGGFPNALEDWNYDKSRGDVEIALRGLFYLNLDSRLTGRVQLGGSPGWLTRSVDIGYDSMLTRNSGFHTMAGLSGGLGRDRYTDNDGDELEVSFANLRVNFGGIYRNKTQAYELCVFAAYHLPFEHLYQPGINEQVIKGAGGTYGMLGIEAAIYFGDFKPPTSKKSKK